MSPPPEVCPPLKCPPPWSVPSLKCPPPEVCPPLKCVPSLKCPPPHWSVPHPKVSPLIEVSPTLKCPSLKCPSLKCPSLKCPPPFLKCPSLKCPPPPSWSAPPCTPSVQTPILIFFPTLFQLFHYLQTAHRTHHLKHTAGYLSLLHFSSAVTRSWALTPKVGVCPGTRSGQTVSVQETVMFYHPKNYPEFTGSL